MNSELLFGQQSFYTSLRFGILASRSSHLLVLVGFPLFTTALRLHTRAANNGQFSLIDDQTRLG